MIELFEYQKRAVKFVEERKKTYLAMGLGTGKTLTSLAAAHRYAKKNVLVIAEKNEIVNSENFRKETAHFEDFTYVNLRKDELPDIGHSTRFVCGINPDALLKQDINRIQDTFDFVIIDEATMAKTTTTKRFKTVRKVCAAIEYVVLLSGTPMLNGASELFAPLALLGHRFAGDGTTHCRQAFETIFAGGHSRKIRNTGKWFQDYVWWAKGANHVRELRYVISDHFFFMRKEDAGIFRKKERGIVRVPMSPEWHAEYNAAWEDYWERVREHNRKADPGKLKNLENISELRNLIENGQVYQVNSRWKAKRVVEDIRSGVYGDRRIVIFSMFRETDDLVREYLGDAGIPFETFEELHSFKEGDAPVLVGRIKAHGKGGNVPEASVALFVDMDFVPSNNTQAENRIDRPEQKNDMTVVYYLADGETVDDHIREINRDKIRKIDEFMRPFTPEEARAMPEAVRALQNRYEKPMAVIKERYNNLKSSLKT